MKKRFIKAVRKYVKAHHLKTGLVSAGIVLFVFSAWIGYIAYTAELPDLTNIEERIIAQSTQIYDREGETLLYDIHGEEKRTVIPFGEIPRSAKNATIAIEDDTFYRHKGIRPLAILRAALVKLRILEGDPRQGGSTITQQLVKSTFLSTERTITRKIKEAILALKIENIYSKDEILHLYLNQIPYGGSVYGIESAAKTYFGKPVRDLALLESAYLAALPKAPTYYSPYGKHVDELHARAAHVLSRMKELGLITEEEYEAAVKEEIKFSKLSPSSIIAPHFVMEIREILRERFGEDAIERGGIKVITTLDVSLQAKAEETIKNFADTNRDNFNANNAGLVAVDPNIGDILAMVGSKDFLEDPAPEGCSPGVNCAFDPQVNVALSLRQPGSSFKPFVYATALKEGYTPETTVFDLPTEFNPLCSSEGELPEGVPPTEENLDNFCYHPSNFDDKFRGPVTLREALAQSLNVPSVKVLYLAGIRDSLKTARDFGITSLTDPERYGLTLVLGGGEVSLLELVSAYGAFAAEGKKYDYRYILRIEDFSGRVLFASQSAHRSVLDENIARTVNNILSDNAARAPAFGEYSALYFPGQKVAAKTGTTNNFRDAWVVGYTPSVVIGMWAGNNDNTSMEKRVAGFIVAPMWREVMRYFLENYPTKNFSRPDPLTSLKPVLKGEWRGGATYTIDKISRKLATEFTPKETREEKVIQEVHSILYWVNKENPDGPAPENPETDSQFTNWEAKVREWAMANGFEDQSRDIIPKDFDDIHTPDRVPVVTGVLISPAKTSYEKEDIVVITPVIQSSYPITQADFLNSGSNSYLGISKTNPFSFSIKVESLVKNMESQNHVTVPILIRVYDSAGNKTEKTVYINVI